MRLVIIILALMLSMTPATIKSNDFLVLATSLCENTKANDRNAIRKALKKAGVKLRRIYTDIRCDGKTLYDFAKEHNAKDVMAYYEKKAKKFL